MIKTFKRGENVQLTPNFHLGELECKCLNCKETLVDLEHIRKVQALRYLIGVPVVITSAYRCQVHNSNVGGAHNSQHTKGTATDIIIPGMDINELQSIVVHFFDGVGLYDHFTHVDSRGSKSRWDKRTDQTEELLPKEVTEAVIEQILKDMEDDLGL